MRFRFELLLLLLACASFAADNDSKTPSETDSMVQSALQAEIDGDPSLRHQRLAQARKQDPKHPAARWHSGYVLIDDRWQTIEDAQLSTVTKGLVGAYRDLRDRLSGGLAGEISLARWCNNNGMLEQERLHWANVLKLDRSNMEARGQLGVREFGGRLLTKEQIETWKQAQLEYDRALRHWNPKLRSWRREIERSSAPEQTDAWRQLSSVNDPRAVPSLEQTFHTAGFDLQRQIVYALGNIDDQVATDALVRVAVYAANAEIRNAAATQLAKRSWFGFVPNLLGRLETPVQCRYLVTTLGAGIFSEVSFSQERLSDVVNVSRSVNSQFPIHYAGSGGGVYFAGPALARRQALIAREASRQYRRVLESVQAVQWKNARTGVLNEQIYEALRTATGQELENQPQAWWEWWQAYNEQYAGEEKPEIELRDAQYRETATVVYPERPRVGKEYKPGLSSAPRRYVSGPPSFARPGIGLARCSCFAAGTSVWTEMGPVVIEEVQPGDRVLSQNPASGELVYRMVLDTTIRPPSPTLRIQVADEELVATLGHPFWVVGRGWKMAKQLKPGDQLHGVHGGVTIDTIETGPEAEAYNLVVADTKTYFVGASRLLVHDNTARRVTDVPVPGWQRATTDGAENDLATPKGLP